MKPIFSYIVLIAFLLLTSCQTPYDKPENLLSKKEITKILTDIYLYKQSIDKEIIDPQANFTTYVSIFKQHNTTKELFQESFSYYYVQPQEMHVIYDDVIKNLKDKLSKEQLKEFNQQKKNKMQKDSIQNK